MSPLVRASFLLLAFAATVALVGVVGLVRDGGQGAEHEIVRTSRGWEPATVTVERGDAVVFRNESGDQAWPASDVHPTHELLPGFDAERGLPDGAAWTFTFDRPGRFAFHDHLAPETRGAIVVR